MIGREYLLSTIRRIKESGRISLCGYFLAGYPSPAEFYRLVRAARQLDVVEFGIPSSEPRLDGPTISSAHQVVVNDRGLDTETALALLGGLRDLVPPRFVMTYAKDGRNLQGFIHQCASYDVHGVFAPDIESGEARHVAMLAQAMNLAYIRFVDPEMTRDQIDEAALSSDLIYLRISPGCTGGAARFEQATCERVRLVMARLRAQNPNILIAGGIGIRNPEQIAVLATLGLDMAIVGTALVEHMALGEDQLCQTVAALREATPYESASWRIKHA